jgi:hypothetical protein
MVPLLWPAHTAIFEDLPNLSLEASNLFCERPPSFPTQQIPHSTHFTSKELRNFIATFWLGQAIHLVCQRFADTPHGT